MADRDLRIVGPEHRGPREGTPRAGRAASVVDVLPEQVLSLPASEVLISLEEATDGAVGSTIDPNTGEPIVGTATRARPRLPAAIGRPTTRRSGRMREYLRLVEGA